MIFYIVKQPLDWFGVVSQYEISLENPSVFQNLSCYFITSLNNPRYSDINSYNLPVLREVKNFYLYFFLLLFLFVYFYFFIIFLFILLFSLLSHVPTLKVFPVNIAPYTR